MEEMSYVESVVVFQGFVDQDGCFRRRRGRGRVRREPEKQVGAGWNNILVLVYHVYS